MRILLFTRRLDYGGAERQLVLLAQGLHARGVGVSVAVFYGGGALEQDLSAEGIWVHDLRKRGRWDMVGFLLRVKRLLEAKEPDVIYSFLDTANVLAVLARLVGWRGSVVWGIRASYVDWSQYDWLGKTTSKVMRYLGRFADLVIVNSHAGLAQCLKMGFQRANIVVICNGIDTDRFQPLPGETERQRGHWKVAPGTAVIGIVGRTDPMKDHETFLEAVSAFRQCNRSVVFVCVGGGSPARCHELQALAARLNVDECVRWVGEMADMRRVYSGFDILTSTSIGEGFPNVVGEAMACGVPCVVTDAGDSARVVGDTGIVVPIGDATGLAAAWDDMLRRQESGRAVLRQAARERIVKEFDRTEMLESTCAALGRLTGVSLVGNPSRSA